MKIVFKKQELDKILSFTTALVKVIGLDKEVYMDVATKNLTTNGQSTRGHVKVTDDEYELALNPSYVLGIIAVLEKYMLLFSVFSAGITTPFQAIISAVDRLLKTTMGVKFAEEFHAAQSYKNLNADVGKEVTDLKSSEIASPSLSKFYDAYVHELDSCVKEFGDQAKREVTIIPRRNEHVSDDIKSVGGGFSLRICDNGLALMCVVIKIRSGVAKSVVGICVPNDKPQDAELLAAGVARTFSDPAFIEAARDASLFTDWKICRQDIISAIKRAMANHAPAIQPDYYTD
jgi:hypothetical protein